MNAFIFLLSFAGFLTAPTPTVKTVSLDEAIVQKLVVADAMATGGYSGESVQLTVTNKSTQPLKIVVPAGFCFYPKNEGEQTLITTEEQSLIVDSQKGKTSNLEAYCSEHDDSAPSSETAFKFGRTKNEKLKKLTAYTALHPNAKRSFQDAVWAVANGSSISNITVNTPEDKALRVFVAELLGIKDSWYSSPQEHRVDEQRNIVSETINIAGNLVFSLDEPTIFHQEVKVKGGELKFTSNGTQPMPKGKNIEYAFKLQVKGWKKGDYEVLLKNDKDKVIGTWDFKV